MFTAVVTRALSGLGLDPRGTAPFPRSTAPMLMHKASGLVSFAGLDLRAQVGRLSAIATVRASPNRFSSLILGQHDSRRKIAYAGLVGTGLSEEARGIVADTASRLGAEDMALRSCPRAPRPHWGNCEPICHPSGSSRCSSCRWSIGSARGGIRWGRCANTGSNEQDDAQHPPRYPGVDSMVYVPGARLNTRVPGTGRKSA